MIAAAACAFGLASSASAEILTYPLQPSQADPGVVAFDDPSYALVDPAASKQAALVVFLPGTHGKPRNALPLLGFVVAQGYRALALNYDDAPAVSQVCPLDPNPRCSEEFRQMRVDGTGDARVSNPPAEAIVHRLAAALALLARDEPSEGWDRYLDGGQPRWERIVVSGLSQGAGMAAYIAKHHAVQRVVLFSSPWDTTGRDRQPAPWLRKDSETPPDRWWAEYHKREVTADLIRQAYKALLIPSDHILAFDNDLPPSYHGGSPNPFHESTIRDVRYADEWRILFGNVTTP